MPFINLFDSQKANMGKSPFPISRLTAFRRLLVQIKSYNADFGTENSYI